MNCDNIIYIVKIQPLDNDWNLTTVGKHQCFCGRLITQFENDSKTQCLVFELNGPRKPTVVIPKGWIKWIALCKHLNHPETYKSCGKHPETKQKLHWKRLTTGE